MIPVLTVTLINLAFFFAAKWRWKNIGFLPFFLMYQATAQHLLVEHDVGPVSLRVYNVAILAGLMGLHLGKVTERLSKVPGLLATFWLWLAYLGWHLVSASMNGALDDPAAFAINFLSKHVMATLTFMAALALLRTKEEVKACTAWLATIALANAVFVILQGQGVDFAWSVQAWMNPLRDLMITETRNTVGEWAIFGYPPGLCSYSITTGYILLCYGLIWGYYGANAWRSDRKPFALLCGLAGMCLFAGTVLCMSRSSLYLGAVLSIPALLVRDSSGRTHKGLAIGMLAGLGLLAMGVLAMRGMQVSVSSTRSVDLERVYDLAFSDRAQLMLQSWDFIVSNPLFGGLETALKTGAIETVPHNFVLNAALYNGFPGALLMIAFTIALVKMLYVNTWGQKSKRLIDQPLAHGLALCAFAFLAKGLVHNDSFVIGGIIGWYLVGLWAANASFAKNETARNAYAPRFNQD